MGAAIVIPSSRINTTAPTAAPRLRSSPRSALLPRTRPTSDSAAVPAAVCHGVRRLTVLDAGVEDGIRKIREQVDEDIAAGDHQDRALDDREVLGQDGVVTRLPRPGRA